MKRIKNEEERNDFKNAVKKPTSKFARQSFCIRTIVDEQFKDTLHAYYRGKNSFYLALYMLL